MSAYGLISDLHLHAWSSFATIDSWGRNSRLMTILDEIDRVCEETIKAGGDRVVIAGDVFHVRGSVAPSVFNPVKDCLDSWYGKIDFVGIPGNHDLEQRDSTKLTSAVEMLCPRNSYWLHEADFCPLTGLYMIPWQKSAEDFKQRLEETKALLPIQRETDLICHVGIDGTLSNLPAHGITPDLLASYGFRRVFSGHYHHHVDFGKGIYSIGAATHQTFSDIGTKAGFMIVYPDRVQWFASHAPSFIDLTGEEDAEDLPLIVDGNYVRARIGTASASDVSDWRKMLIAAGAKGVLIEAVPDTAGSKRAGVTVKSLSALATSVSDYIREKGMRPQVSAICSDILTEVRSAA